MSGADSLYEILGVARSADAAEIRLAYLSQARRWHPDRHPEWSPEQVEAGEVRMALVADAWRVLRDSQRRESYDAVTFGEKVAPPLSDEDPLEQPDRRWQEFSEDPDPPRGFELYGSLNLWALRTRPSRQMADKMADEGKAAISLSAMQADLSSLDDLPGDSLWRLRVDNLPVDDVQLIHLRRMVRLEELTLARTRVTDAGLVHLARLTSLRVLDLWGTAVTDRGLEIIGGLTSLERLNIGATNVTDAGLAHLRQLTTLDELNLRGTRVRGPGLEHLHGLSDLDHVALPALVRPKYRRALAAAQPEMLLT